eukprot:13494790-Alexandrium_andersonii.AAC.1
MMCYDRATEIIHVLSSGLIGPDEAQELRGVHSDVFTLTFVEDEAQHLGKARKRRRLILRQVLPFKHGAVGGVVSQTVLETPVVKRSCSWSCHHCLLPGHRPDFQRELQSRN